MCKTLFNVCTASVADFMYLHLHKQIFIYIYEKVDMIKKKKKSAVLVQNLMLS